MAKLSILAAALALVSFTNAADCGAGTPEATVTGSEGAYEATKGSSSVYSGSDYFAAIDAALSAIASGERVAVMASGSIGTNVISIDSGKIFEGCGTIDLGYKAGKGGIESLNTKGVSIPYLSLTGAPYFAMHFYGTTDLSLGKIVMNLSGGLGIRFDRDEAANTNVKMDSIQVTGAGSHAVETWNIDGLTINEVIAKDVGECGLLLQMTTNAKVGLVDADNVASGTGYAALRFANQNGKLNGGYETNVFVDKLVAKGGGRGLFCVSESGGAEIGTVSISDTENNAILIENCYSVTVLDGTVSGGGEVRISARDEFANTDDIELHLQVDGTTVLESPCGTNIVLDITGSASVDKC
ncbi:hypothetical protein V495_07606 [Pseudogymnoascus sp. VKM F-4514 (FW-929)]|nr:hypothetical protein V495_07606 [Pseudogymnoascus sp. VKM F-4514 (FW-929)]KFY51741.1 hypothetical protein V497_08888 [Pseudogymnoascus sp. VKM F-4516 (FW-969)]